MFLIYCTNKGCGREVEPLLNTQTNEVECTECGKVISTVTSFTKTQMKAMGQIKRVKQVRQAFATICKQCKVSAQPQLKNNKLVCSECDTEFNFDKIRDHAIKEFLHNKNV